MSALFQRDDSLTGEQYRPANRTVYTD